MKTVNSPSIKEAKLAANQNTNFLIKKGYVRAGFYTYTDESEVPIYWRIRLDHPEKEKWIRPFTLINGKWEFKEPTFDHGKTLYNLHGIANKPNETVWIVEGEKCVDALAKLGILATTSGSATSAEGADWEPLKNRSAIIWPDNDEPGIKYADEVTAILQGMNCKVQWIDVEKLWPADNADNADGVDWIQSNEGASIEDIQALSLIEPIQKIISLSSSDPEKQPRQSQVLVDLTSSCELFTSDDDRAYASIPIENRLETWPIDSSGFNYWLSREYFITTQTSPSKYNLAEALSVLEGMAKYEGGCFPVYTRIAEFNEKVYLDLVNDNWEVIEVSNEGWQILPTSPVKFIRSSGMLSIPSPESGGSVDILRNFINLPNDDDFIILITYLLFSLQPAGPYPILILQGEQGSAKSTFGKLIRFLLDPSSASLRTTPKNIQDLMIAAQNGWLLNFDNLSNLPPWLSDALCRLSTGAGFSTRKLYANSEEAIFNACRPICLNGITEFATRDDLLDRSLILKLPSIPDHKRKDEKTFWKEFELYRPKVLGALLDQLSLALINLPSIHLSNYPRMADYAKFSTAIEIGMDWEKGAFMQAYEANRIHSVIMGIEADPVAQAIRDWDIDKWEGTATDLLKELGGLVDETIQRSKAWPTTPNFLGNKIRRFIPPLRKLGIEIELDRSGHEGTRLITISRSQIDTVSVVSKSHPPDLFADDAVNVDKDLQGNNNPKNNVEEREVFSL